MTMYSSFYGVALNDEQKYWVVYLGPNDYYRIGMLVYQRGKRAIMTEAGLAQALAAGHKFTKEGEYNAGISNRSKQYPRRTR